MSPTCEIEGIVLSEKPIELKGAIVNTYQAVGLAKRLGIIVRSTSEEE
ncbi:hypothetical protein M2454_002553 [Aequitasia blattaphilus]|uniref:Uncharacterized protein n=1 Tax=Aequitasia blattaphilus TaxID=2949332 RepID=A0ABT1ECA4_9FIRM|nr:hypothetical protein [Aequitasia blattaphilus]MCP1103463.1 hypothetical protein [Aequitasia blattaphilus]MCR8616103.1 hypothetical protein [Aequitasia blattaphilus]